MILDDDDKDEPSHAVSGSQDDVIAEAKKRRLTSGSKNRVAEILDALVEVIETSGLKSGDRLPPEKLLAESFGVSRSSIREALTSWQRMGLVVRNKGAGTRLAANISAASVSTASASAASLATPLSLRVEAEGLMRTHVVRRPLEIEAVRLATLSASDIDRRIIRARCDELQAVFESGRDWTEADRRFHAAIHEASGNPIFGQLISQLHNAFHDIYEVPMGSPLLGSETIPAHVALADAIIAGDVDEAVRRITDILGTVETDVTGLLDG